MYIYILILVCCPAFFFFYTTVPFLRDNFNIYYQNTNKCTEAQYMYF